MDIFRIKHIPTGLYYKPAGTTGNLSATGKLYSRKQPKPTYITVRFHTSRGILRKEHKLMVDAFNIDTSKLKKGKWFSFRDRIQTEESDWEFETIKS